MKLRFYVSGLSFLDAEVSEEEAADIIASYDNRGKDRITVKIDGEVWNIAKAHIVAIAYINKPERPAGVTLN